MSESGFITLLSSSNVHIYSSKLLCLLPLLLNTSFLQQFLNQRRKNHSKSWRGIPLLRHPSNCNISPKHQVYTFLNLPSPSSLTINSLRGVFCFFVFLLLFSTFIASLSSLEPLLVIIHHELWHPLVYFSLHMCPCLPVFIHSLIQSVNLNWVPYGLSFETMVVNMMGSVLALMEFIVKWERQLRRYLYCNVKSAMIKVNYWVLWNTEERKLTLTQLRMHSGASRGREGRAIEIFEELTYELNFKG